MSALPLGSRLTLARHLRGLTGVELATAAGVTASMLSAYESARVLPGLHVLVRLADALEVTTDFLVGRTADPVSAGLATQRLLERLGSLTADELQTLDDLSNAWTARRRPEHPLSQDKAEDRPLSAHKRDRPAPPRLVVPEPL